MGSPHVGGSQEVKVDGKWRPNCFAFACDCKTRISLELFFKNPRPKHKVLLEGGRDEAWD